MVMSFPWQSRPNFLLKRDERVFLINPPWPKRILISDEFLHVARLDCVQRSQGRVTFTLANTSAIYAVEYVPLANLWSGRLVEGTFA